MTRASGAVVDPRASLAMWLRTGRTQRNLTLADVARITKIQPRILEKLEAGNLEGLPADVFVKGFVRSFAKCVGLNEVEALDRLGAARSVTGSGQATAVARAFVDSMSVRLVPPAGSPSALAAEPAIEPEVEIEIQHDAVASSPTIEVVEVVELAPLALITPVVEVVADAATETPKKKRASRKKSPSAAPRTRKKKTAVVEAVSAETAAIEIAQFFSGNEIVG